MWHPVERSYCDADQAAHDTHHGIRGMLAYREVILRIKLQHAPVVCFATSAWTRPARAPILTPSTPWRRWRYGTCVATLYDVASAYNPSESAAKLRMVK
jgi:hypothetical protein